MGSIRRSDTQTVVLEESPIHAGNVKVTVWNHKGEAEQYEITDEGKAVYG